MKVQRGVLKEYKWTPQIWIKINSTLKHDFNVEYSEKPNEFITKILK